MVYSEQNIILSEYRPFTKKWLYYSGDVVEYPAKFKNSFGENNLIIFTTGTGISRNFSAIIVNNIPNYHLMDTGQAYLRYDNSQNHTLLDNNSNIENNVLNIFGLTEDNIFFYVYGVLNSSEYKIKYANDLKKSSPRIPLLKNKEKYVEIGNKLANLHLNYENQPSWNGVEVVISNSTPNYKVTKMKHPKKGVLDTIIYNEHITIKNIPEKAYEYIVNGRPAIEWIIDQYQIKTDKKSGITDDPNEFSDDPKYILNLLLSIITVSMKTLELIDELPEFEVVEA